MTLENSYTTGPLLGQGWKQVEEWPQAGPSRLRGAIETNGEVDAAMQVEEDDEDEYEEEEEEIYVLIDLGPNADPLTLGISTEYQLIGLDTPTPFMKIGNDVFQGTPQRLIGSEIITKDTRDPQNPIKHSHPTIGHTDYRLSLEPVKLVPHSTDPANQKSTERPPLFARDAPGESATHGVSNESTGSTSAGNGGEETGSPMASTSSHPTQPASAAPSSKRKPAAATRATPLSTRFIIPASGEISADGIPRIDGQEIRRIRKPRKLKKSAPGAEDGPDDSSMDVDRPDAVREQAVAGPSNLPSDSVRDTRPPDLQRLFMPDAPRGYTKRGVPRKAPGRKAQPKKTVVEGTTNQQTSTVNQTEQPVNLSVLVETPVPATTGSTTEEGDNATQERDNATEERVDAPHEGVAIDVDGGNAADTAPLAEPGATDDTTQGPLDPSADQE